MRPASPAKLLPRRALLHPLWLAALVTMALNDHVFKGAGLLPGEVTGKLSDFAGLLVAPLLLATLLRVRGRLGWVTAHVCVGVIFAAIQMSRPFADLFSNLMGLVGFPWAITCDPWDLVALPMLLVSFAFYPRVMGRSNTRKAVQYAAAGGGLAACVATSPPDDGSQPWWIDGDVYFHNDNDFDAVIRVRSLADAVEVDCNAVEEDPGRYLTPPMFGEAESWTVWPNANLPLIQEFAPLRDCNAVLLEADSMAPVVIFWRNGQVEFTSIQGEGIDANAPGFVSLRYDAEGRGTYETGLDILFEAVEPPGRPEGICAPQDDADRFVFADEIPTGIWFLGDVDPGVDGCATMELRTGFEQQEEIAGFEWTVCLPQGAFPFEAGQRVEVLPDHLAEGEGLTMRELEPLGNAPTGLELHVVTGANRAGVLGIETTFVPVLECTLQVESACGTVTQPGSMTLSGGGFNGTPLWLGQVVSAVDGDAQVDVYLTHAEERVALNPECAAGPDALGLDVEMVAVRRP